MSNLNSDGDSDSDDPIFNKPIRTMEQMIEGIMKLENQINKESESNSNNSPV